MEKNIKKAYLFVCHKTNSRILKGLGRDSGDYYPKIGQTKRQVNVVIASDQDLKSELAKLGLKLDKKSTISLKMVAEKFFEELIRIENGQLAWDGYGKKLYKIIK